MNKRSICIINAALAIVLFLCLYGYVCYLGGVDGHGGSDFIQWILICIYYVILVILAIVSVHFTYLSKKYYLFVAIYSVIFSCVLIVLWILAGCNGIGKDEISSIWLLVVMSILTPIISGLYFYGAFSKKE